MRFKRIDSIGAYGTTFNKRTLFIYKMTEELIGYFIKKSNWYKILNYPQNQ